MKRTTKQNITNALENILEILFFVALIAFIFSFGIMVENWKITTAPLIVAIASLVYLLKMGAYVYLINR